MIFLQMKRKEAKISDGDARERERDGNTYTNKARRV